MLNTEWSELDAQAQIWRMLLTNLLYDEFIQNWNLLTMLHLIK